MSKNLGPNFMALAV